MLFPDEPFFNVYDGALGALAFNDEKPMAIWSHYHADALASRLVEFRSRLRVAEWTVQDCAARLAGASAASDAERTRLTESVQRAEAEREVIRARLVELTARARVMEAARVADWYAIKTSPFDFGDER